MAWRPSCVGSSVRASDGDSDAGSEDFTTSGAVPAKVECPNGHVLEGYEMRSSDSANDTHYFACCKCGEESMQPCIYISKRHGCEIRPVEANELLAFYLSMKSHVARMQGVQQVMGFLQMKHDMMHFDEHAKWLCLRDQLLERNTDGD